MMVELLSDSEIEKMREELNSEVYLYKINPPLGREYWDVRRIVKTLEYFQKLIKVEDRCTCDEHNETHPCPNQEGIECACCPYCTSNCAKHLAEFFEVEEEDILSGKMKIIRKWSKDFKEYGFKAIRV